MKTIVNNSVDKGNCGNGRERGDAEAIQSLIHKCKDFKNIKIGKRGKVLQRVAWNVDFFLGFFYYVIIYTNQHLQFYNFDPEFASVNNCFPAIIVLLSHRLHH